MNLIKEMTNQLTSFYVELLARFYRYKYVLPFNRLTLTRKKKKPSWRRLKTTGRCTNYTTSKTALSPQMSPHYYVLSAYTDSLSTNKY